MLRILRFALLVCGVVGTEWPADLPKKFNWCERGACGISRNQCDGTCAVHAWYGTQESHYWLSTGSKGKVRSVSSQPFTVRRDSHLSLDEFDHTHGLFFEETFPEAGTCRMCTNEFLPVMEEKLGKCYPALKTKITEDACLIRDYFFAYKQFPRDIKASKCSQHVKLTLAQQAGWPADNNSTIHSKFGTYADCKANFDATKSCTSAADQKVKADVAPGTFHGIFWVPVHGDVAAVARLMLKWGPQRAAMSGVEAGEPDIDRSNQACAKKRNHEAIVVGWDRTGKVPKWIVRNSELPNNDVYGLGYVDMDCPHCTSGGCAAMTLLTSKSKATVNVFVDPSKTKGDARGKFSELLAMNATWKPVKSIPILGSI